MEKHEGVTQGNFEDYLTDGYDRGLDIDNARKEGRKAMRFHKRGGARAFMMVPDLPWLKKRRPCSTEVRDGRVGP